MGQVAEGRGEGAIVAMAEGEGTGQRWTNMGQGTEGRALAWRRRHGPAML